MRSCLIVLGIGFILTGCASEPSSSRTYISVDTAKAIPACVWNQTCKAPPGMFKALSEVNLDLEDR